MDSGDFVDPGEEPVADYDEPVWASAVSSGLIVRQKAFVQSDRLRQRSGGVARFSKAGLSESKRVVMPIPAGQN